MKVKVVCTVSGTRHYSEAVSREVIEAVTPVRYTTGKRAAYLWIAPSEQAAAEHATRPENRTGPILIAVRGTKLAEDTWLVFHCFRVRGPDRRDWAENGGHHGQDR